MESVQLTFNESEGTVEIGLKVASPAAYSEVKSVAEILKNSSISEAKSLKAFSISLSF